MKIRFTHTSYVTNFLDKFLHTQEVNKALEEYTSDLLPNLGMPDWEINFKPTYGNKESIAIFKKGQIIKSARRKEIVIHVPVPTKEIVFWGVDKKSHVKVALPPNWEKNFHFIDVDPSDFNDLQSYVIYCLKVSVKKVLKTGFVLNGQKIIALSAQ
ncbi:MAG: Imm9 family immunity protein [Bacteroidota bacterium]